MVSFPSIGLIERRELALPQNTRWDRIPRTAFSFIPLKDAFLPLEEPTHSSKCIFSVYVWPYVVFAPPDRTGVYVRSEK